MRKIIAALSMMVIVTAVMGARFIFAQDATPAATSAATAAAAPDAPWLGVGVTESNQQVVIAQVQPGSPAETAQLAVGDVIVSFNGSAVTSISELAADVLAMNNGDSVTLDVLRAGKPLTVDVILTSVSAAAAAANLAAGLDPLVISGTMLSAQFTEVATGYQVTAVNATTNPFKLAVGDVVTSINGQNVQQLNLIVLQKALANQALPRLTITIMRDGSEMTLQGQPPVGSLSFSRPGNQEDIQEGNHRDDQNGEEGGGEDGEGGVVVPPVLANPTAQIPPESTLPAEAISQI